MKKEMQRKVLFFCLATFLFVILISNLIAAQAASTAETNRRIQESTTAFMTGFKDGLKQVIGPLLTPLFGTDQLFTKLLLGVLLWMVIYSLIGNLFGSSWLTTWFISLAVAVLAMIAIPADLISVITLQYGAMGAAILSIIPFMIILIFTVKVRDQLTARLLWIFFCIYYFAILIYDWMNVGYWSAASVAYGFALAAGIFIFFFIGVIRRAMFKGEMDSIKASGQKIVDEAKLLHRVQHSELDGYKDAGKGI